ncbi:MAG: 30S ribosomal protein S13 [Candidatus Aenigmarchaeota archaeon]|nr:30S ribosomal protein S13 [Candidatus Aenigmarchaeota archaeon]
MPKTDKEKPSPDIKHGKEKKSIIRLGESNLDGNKRVSVALRGIKGVSFSFANAVAYVSGLGNKRLGELSDEEIAKIEDIINNPSKHGIPSWLYNRRKDFETGENKHLTGSQLEITKKLDIDREKKLRSYRGVRHSLGLPVRGQRTRGSFRKGRTVGVSRKKGGR